jgi:hypothetical protein
MAVRSALRAGRPLPPGRFLILISVRGWGDPIVRLEGLVQLKNPMTSSGIDPVTFRLVAQCLSQLRYRLFPDVWNETSFAKLIHSPKSQRKGMRLFCRTAYLQLRFDDTVAFEKLFILTLSLKQKCCRIFQKRGERTSEPLTPILQNDHDVQHTNDA